MTMKLVFALAAAGAGVAAAFQSAANAGLAARTSLGAALVVNTTIVLAGTLVFFFASGSRPAFFPSGTPASLYIGGLCGFAIIAGAAFAFPKIGAGAAVALMVLGQGAAALAIDHFGLLGMPREPISFTRAGGFALVVAGIALLRH